MDNKIQVKYDVDLQYKGTELVGIIECYKIECKGIPCIKDGKLELANTLYTQRNSDNISTIKFIEINNIIYSVSDVEYWYIDTEEILKQIDCLIDNKEKIPNSYIKISDKFYSVENIEDLLELDTEGDIKAFCFSRELEDNDLLFKILEDYLDSNINVLIEELEILLSIIGNDKEVLIALLYKNPSIHYWINSVDLYYYNLNTERAYARHLEEVENIPSKVIDYMDVYSYIENELDMKTLECNNRTVLYW